MPVSESKTELVDRDPETAEYSGCYAEVTTTGAEEEAVLEVTVDEFEEGLVLPLPSSRQWIALWRRFGKPFALQVEQTCK